MLHRVNYRSAAFGSESVAFEEPDQRVRKARSETMGLRVKSEVTIWRAARRVQSVSPPPPLSCADLIRASIYHAARSSVSRSEEHTSELQSLMRISYAVFCLKKKKEQY